MSQTTVRAYSPLCLQRQSLSKPAMVEVLASYSNSAQLADRFGMG